MKLADLVMRGSAAVLAMKERGMLVHRERMHTLYMEAIARAKSLEDSLCRMVGDPTFNPRSPKMVADLLYTGFGLPEQRKRGQYGRPGNVTTDDDAIMRVCNVYEDYETKELKWNGRGDRTIWKIGSTILDCRRSTKLASTYFSLPLDEHDRFHPEWKIHGTETGRYSCHVHTYPPGKPRSIFVAPPGYKLVVGDLSQIELRIMWTLSRDPVGMDIMARGGDAHRETASEIFHKPAGEVTGHERFSAKFVNFGLPYGRGPESMAEQHTTITLDEARHIFDAHHNRFTVLWEWMARNNVFSAKNRYISNPFGRRRYFSGDVGAAEQDRQTQNFTPQSTAHDILTHALVDIHDNLSDRCFPVFDHHDALGMEVSKEGLSDTVTQIRAAFETPRIPGLITPCEIKVLDNWGEAKR